jgi:hypothetical protein
VQLLVTNWILLSDWQSYTQLTKFDDNHLMELPTMSTSQQIHTLIVFGPQSFLLCLTPNNTSGLVIYLENYLTNTMTHSADILVCSSDT